MTKKTLDKQADHTKFNVQAEAQKQKMDQAATKHAGKMKGNTEPNAGGENREAEIDRLKAPKFLNGFEVNGVPDKK